LAVGLLRPVPPATGGKVPEVNVRVLVEYIAELGTKEFNPVPPLAVRNVPPNVIAPICGVYGVNPVSPPLSDVCMR